MVNADSDRLLFLVVKILALALIFMYGIVPYYFAILLGQGGSAGTDLNAFYSFALFIILGGFFVCVPIVKKYIYNHLLRSVAPPHISSNSVDLSLTSIANKDEIHHGNTLIDITARPPLFIMYFVFVVALVIFSYFPWIKDRESFGAKMAAIMRIAWLLVVILFGDRKGGWACVMTVVLMLIDRSRTYFFVALAVLTINIPKRYWGLLGVLLIFVIGFVAITRDSSLGAFNIVDIVMYGLEGEGVNGSLGVMQILPFKADANILSIVSPFIQPFIAPINSLLKYLSFQPIDSAVINYKLILNYTGQVYYPMGGFYILSEFINFGNIGIIVLATYLMFSLTVLSKIVRINRLNAGIAFFPLAVKSTPYIFWNMVYAFIVACFFIWCMLKIKKMLWEVIRNQRHYS